MRVEAEQRAVRAEAEADRERRRRIDVGTQLAYANVRVGELERQDALLFTAVECTLTAT